MSEVKWKVAKYLRKSYSDDKSAESDSVSNQRKILDSYIETQPDMETIGEWVDDGVSGLIFDRPAFKAMMTAIENGEITCVVVKDAKVKPTTTLSLNSHKKPHSNPATFQTISTLLSG